MIINTSYLPELFQISETLQPLIGDTLDPFNISRAIPGGEVAVSEEGSVYQANLTMSHITMYNLSQAYLKKVTKNITHSKPRFMFLDISNPI